MSRGLRPVFLVLFLASAVAASAGPDDLFDARIPGALQPGQKETILALDNGRYTLKDGHFLDARAADPARVLLTNARVAELLSAPTGGTRPDGVNAAAGDAAYQRAMARVPKGAPAQMNFDGGAARGGGIRGPPAAGVAGAAASSDPAVLQAQLLQRLVFKGNKKEREALGEAVSMILKTRTGRELAAQFIAERASAEVAMADIANSTTVVEGGRKTLSGGPGFTEVEKDPPVVSLNRVYLDADPEWRRLAMTGTLAHELFGHAFETQRAKKAGMPPAVDYYYRGDEVGSEIIDWLVQTELAGKVVDGSPGAYLDNQEKYYRGLWTTEAYYSTTLSLAEMKNPVASLKARRKAVDAEEAATKTDLKDNEDWEPIIAHFTRAHGMPRARFAPADEELRAFRLWAAGHLKKLVEIREALAERIKFWSSPAGAAEKKAVMNGANSDYLKKREALLAARAAALRRLVGEVKGGRAPAPVLSLPDIVSAAPKAGEAAPIDLDGLGALYAADLKTHPKHWRK
ncbi:MAG: hypothetical protein PHS14_04590 [Elusimicrobia bacterium]|nr:hypothetical protein [Elusimicrobiota bacterium]